MDRKKKFFTTKRIAFLARWWSAGAVYFFIAWGTTIGKYSYIDLIFFLGVFIGLFYMLIVNPVLSDMFNIVSKYRYKDVSVGKLMIYRISEIVKSITIVAIIAFIMDVLNKLLIAILPIPKDSVPFPGEPISFGLFYVLLYVLFEKLIDLFRNRKNKGTI